MPIQPLQILVIEGETLSHYALERALEGRHAIGAMISAANSQTALRRLQSGLYDLVLLENLSNPEETLDLLEQIIEARIGLPIILLVDEGEYELVDKAINLGTDTYLFKDHMRSFLRVLPTVIEKAYRDWQDKQTSKRHMAQLALINEIGSQIVAVQELDRVLERTTFLLQKAFGYHHVALFLLDNDVARLKAVAGAYKDYFKPGHVQQLNEGIIGWVARTGEKLVANDVQSEPHFISLIGNHTSTKSELCFPIKIGGQTLGVLDIQSTRPHIFTGNDIIVLETLVDDIAVAIENARLYGELRQELTERSQAEEALQNAYQRLTFYIENSPLLVVEWNDQYQVTHWSQEAAAFFGWSAETVLNKKPDEWDFIHKEDAAKARAMRQELLAGQEPGNFDTQRNFTKDGSTVYCEWYNSSIRDENGKLVSILSLVLDVTERRQAIRDLRESEERYRNVISSISDHIYVGEIAEDGETFYTSPNVEALTGYPVEAFADWGFWQTLIHRDDLSLAENQRVDIGHDSEVEYRMRRADNAVIWVRDSRRHEVEHDQSGQVKRHYVYGVVNDITERKLAELALEDERALLAKRVEERTAELSAVNAALARAARLKDEFLANMSHELRTPLNAILGKSETLQEGIYGSLNEKQLRSMRLIEESGRHLLSLINDILDVSKIEAGKFEMEIRPISVSWVCETSLRLVKEMANKKNLELVSELDESVSIIQADGRRLKQILVNLLSNAIKFTPKSGRVGLKITGDTEREVVHFTVWDTGIGISEEDLGQLFQPFVQLDSSLSRQYEGTGLGLSLVYRMTKMHGGGVSVKSKENEGSQFTVSLPWRLETVAEEAAEISSATQLPADSSLTPTESPNGSDNKKMTYSPTDKKPVVLVVEDNETNIDTLMEYLPHKGYRVLIARNGTEAIERAREIDPHIILMDIQTPGLDGLEATRYIRQDPDLQHIPIVALTALAMPGDRERCLAAGATQYMSKPVSLKQLAATIWQEIEGQFQNGQDR